MSAWMNALGAMLQTGGAIGMKRAQDKQDAQTQLLADEVKENRAKLRKLQGPATHFQTKRNGPDGATIEEVNEESYNEETGTRDSRVISTYTSPAKEKRAETEIEYMERNPEGYKQKVAIDKGPSKVSTPKAPKDTTAADAKSLAAEVYKAVSAYASLDPEDKASVLAEYGIDPASGDARAQYENAKRDELTRIRSGQPAGKPLMRVSGEAKYPEFGAENPPADSGEFGPKPDLMSGIPPSPAAPSAPIPAGQKPAQAQAGASQANPIPAASLKTEPPPGTWVQLPDGRVIQTPKG